MGIFEKEGRFGIDLFSFRLKSHLLNFRIFKYMKTRQDILPQYLKSKLPALQKLCQKYQVKYLYAIGSVLTDKFRDDSDVDLLYELDRPSISDDKYLPTLDGLIAGLIDLFEGREIDLIHYPSLKNPYFIEEVDETKVLLYEQNREEVSV